MMLLKLAFRNLKRQRRRTVLTGLTMAGGYFLLSLFVSIAEGSYSVIIESMAKLHTGHVQIHAKGYLQKPKITNFIADSDQLLDVLAKNQTIESSPRIFAGSLAFTDEKSTGVQIVGIDPGKERRVSNLPERISKGVYLSEIGSDQVLLGFTAAKVLKAGPGDPVYLISQGVDGSVANDAFTVGGIVGDGTNFDRMSIYLDIQSARRFLSMSTGAHEIVVKGPDYRQADKLQRRLEAAVNDDRLDVETWKDVEPEFYRSMVADKEGNNITFVIIGILVAITVLNTILMATLERSREFGLLKAIGTRPRTLFSMVVTEVTMLSVLSVLAGLVLSLAANYWLATRGIKLPEPFEVGGFTMDRISGEISLTTIGFPMVEIFICAVVVAIFPAIKVAQSAPVKSLRAT